MAYRRTPEIEERLRQRRAEIVAAARTSLVAQGYCSTTMQGVARAAGTSVGNLYFHFQDKDAVVQAVVDEIVREIGLRADRAEALASEGAARIAAATYAGVLVVLEQRALCRRVLAEPGTHALRQRVQRLFVQRFRARLELERSLACGLDLELFAQAAQGAMFHVLENALLSNSRVDSRRLARFLAGFNLRALGHDQVEVERVVTEVERIVLQKSKPMGRASAKTDEVSS